MLQIGYTPHGREVEDENLGLPGIVSVGDFTEFSRGGGGACMYGRNYHHNLYGKNSGSLYEKNYHHASQHVSISYCLVNKFSPSSNKNVGQEQYFLETQIVFPIFAHGKPIYPSCILLYLQSHRAGPSIWVHFGLWFNLDPCPIWWPLAGSDFGLRDFSTQPLWPYMANNILFKRCSIVLQNITAAPSSSVQMMLWQWHRQMAMSQMISEI